MVVASRFGTMGYGVHPSQNIESTCLLSAIEFARSCKEEKPQTKKAPEISRRLTAREMRSSESDKSEINCLPPDSASPCRKVRIRARLQPCRKYSRVNHGFDRLRR